MKTYKEYALELFLQGDKTKSEIALIIKDEYKLEYNIETLRKNLPD